MDTLGPDDIILFLDECSVNFSPTITRCWALKGNQPEILTLGGRKRQPIIGVVDPIKGTVHKEFINTLKALQFQKFLEEIIKVYHDKRKIIIVLDNAKAHHARALQPFLENVKDKIELLFLPPYSPNINPIERVWKLMRKMVTHNTFFNTFTKLIDALKSFFLRFKYPSTEIISLCKIF